MFHYCSYTCFKNYNILNNGPKTRKWNDTEIRIFFAFPTYCMHVMKGDYLASISAWSSGIIFTNSVLSYCKLYSEKREYKQFQMFNESLKNHKISGGVCILALHLLISSLNRYSRIFIWCSLLILSRIFLVQLWWSISFVLQKHFRAYDTSLYSYFNREIIYVIFVSVTKLQFALQILVIYKSSTIYD
jgi:hypothetical protein